MLRYYFHLDNEHTIEDDEGEQFETLAKAQTHAQEVAQELSAHQTESHIRDVFIRVVDGRGNEVFRTSLAGETKNGS
jgi:hypothetical protein